MNRRGCATRRTFSVAGCRRACCECVTLSVGTSSLPCSSLTLKLRCPTSQTRPAGDGCPCPHRPGRCVQSPSSPWAGGLSPFSAVSSQDGQLLLFISPHKSQARRACCVRVSVAGGLGGGPSLPFLPPTPESHAEFACLLETAALTSGLGQVKGT